MMRMRCRVRLGFVARALAAILAWSGILLVPVRAAESEILTEYPEIEYAYPDTSVWTIRTDQDGRPDNPLLRLAAELFRQAGVRWHGAAYPAVRLFNALEDGTAQFSMLVKAPALARCCLMSRAPVAASEIRVYHRESMAPVLRREDLAGFRVILIRGYSYAGLADFLADPANRIAAEATTRHEMAFAMLAAGRGDYLVDYAGPADEVLAARPMPELRSEVLSRQEVFLVLRKTYPEAPALLARLEAIAASLDREAILKGPSR
jgi:hypothetical protein